MQFLTPLLEASGGLVYQSLRLSVDQFRSLLIQHLGESPTGRPAARIEFSCLDPEDRQSLRLHLELCDLGWMPYYYLNEFQDQELCVYTQLRGGVTKVHYSVRALLVQLSRDWEEHLLLLQLEHGSFTLEREGAPEEQLELFQAR